MVVGQLKSFVTPPFVFAALQTPIYTRHLESYPSEK
jgi:hypothetical protein